MDEITRAFGTEINHNTRQIPLMDKRGQGRGARWNGETYMFGEKNKVCSEWVRGRIQLPELIAI